MKDPIARAIVEAARTIALALVVCAVIDFLTFSVPELPPIPDEEEGGVEMLVVT